MLDIQKITTGLKLNEDGVWYSEDAENISYPQDGNESCFEIEENSFWFKHRNNCIGTIVKSFPPESSGTIFDVGGGNGYVSVGLSNLGFDVALVEPGITGATNAKKRGLENVICATTAAAQFKKNSLSAVGLFDVVEHIENDLDFLKQIKTLIQKNGRVYVTVPAYRFLWSAKDIHAGHFRRYSLSSIENILKAAGFEIEFSSYIFRFLPLPILFLSVLPFKLGLSKKERTNDARSRDHAVKGGIGVNILNSLLRSEVGNLDKKKTMRFGGSCLVVAKAA